MNFHELLREINLTMLGDGTFSDKFSSFSSSTWMPESPELHLSRRCDFVFLRSLLDLQTSGPKLKVIALINHSGVADGVDLPMMLRLTRLEAVDSWQIRFAVFEKCLFEFLQNASGG